MSLVGPDGRPLIAPMIGQPTLEELAPFSPEDMVHIAAPLRQAMAGGVPLEAPATVETGVIARLISTVLHLQAAANAEEPEEPGEE